MILDIDLSSEEGEIKPGMAEKKCRKWGRFLFIVLLEGQTSYPK